MSCTWANTILKSNVNDRTMTVNYSTVSEHDYNAKQINKAVILGHSVIVINWTH